MIRDFNGRRFERVGSHKNLVTDTEYWMLTKVGVLTSVVYDGKDNITVLPCQTKTKIFKTDTFYKKTYEKVTDYDL